jgi:hypothetical protein
VHGGTGSAGVTNIMGTDPFNLRHWDLLEESVNYLGKV